MHEEDTTSNKRQINTKGVKSIPRCLSYHLSLRVYISAKKILFDMRFFAPGHVYSKDFIIGIFILIGIRCHVHKIEKTSKLRFF